MRLRSEETTYLYDGLQVFQEFTGEGSPLAEYMRGNALVASRQTFGFHGRKDEGREGNLRTRGGLLYYGYDGLGSVTDLTDRTGAEVMQYRYDAFGGLYTGITSPYNTVGFTGKSYDPKASLVQFYSRWYDPSVGRFTAQDSYLGELIAPASQHRYAYVLNNPVTKIDPWGYHDPGDPGGTFSSWYSYEPEYDYANEQTVTDSSTTRSGEYLVTTTVTTVYADKYKVVYKYYNDSDGAHELVSESAPQYLGRVVESRSTSQTSVYSPLPPTGGDPNDGKPNDGKPNDGNPSDGNPSDGNPSNGNPGGGGGGTGGTHTPTPQEIANDKRLQLEVKAGQLLADLVGGTVPALEQYGKVYRETPVYINGLPSNAISEVSVFNGRALAETLEGPATGAALLFGLIDPVHGLATGKYTVKEAAQVAALNEGGVLFSMGIAALAVALLPVSAPVVAVAAVSIGASLTAGLIWDYATSRLRPKGQGI